MKNKLDTIYLMKLFAAIVHHGSFAAAARQLSVTPSKASKDIQYLESLLDTRLLQRSTRHVTTTDAGELFYHKSREILELNDELLDSLSSQKTQLSGELRLTAPELWGERILTPIILAFKQCHPDVRIKASFSNETSDLHRDKLHIAFRSTQISNEPYLARLIMADESLLCASPDYLSRHAAPENPEALARHEMITLTGRDKAFDRIKLLNANQKVEIQLDGELSFNNKNAIYQAVKAGLGIAVLPKYLVEAELHRGELVTILPDYRLASSNFYALYSHRRKDSALINLFIDFVIAQITPATTDANSPS
ncbi:LysR family transcriptional regulator [Shewanella insulae]|uniref:LysR family transcriptional regulator n=1 Tax=Shewanella insulae TaxID=2681496 RepID=UPI001EFDAF54|nr:LysR family transcriptional regulator [Shewanella insulae]MCG9739687.1 LysR family transcriptional regulator [Shewanella insulae]